MTLDPHRKRFDPFTTKTLVCGCTAHHLCAEAKRLSDLTADPSLSSAGKKLAAYNLAQHRKAVCKGYRMALDILESKIMNHTGADGSHAY